MTTLKILLLGGFAVTLDNRPITKFRSAKSRALLAYLATQPNQALARTTLAALLWGDLPEKAAKTNLRVELSKLKKVLQDPPTLEIGRQTVRFNSQLATVDVVTFREAVRVFTERPFELQAQHLTELEQAITLYQEEFLAGFHLANTVEFDDW